MSRKVIPIGVLAGTLILIVLYLGTSRQSGSEVQVPPVPAATTLAPNIPRPSNWFGIPAPTAPSIPLAEFERQLDAMVHEMSALVYDRRPLTNAELLAKIHRAQALVAAGSVGTILWQEERVRRVVAEYGRSRPIMMPPPEIAGHSGFIANDAWRVGVFVWDGAGKEDDALLAMRLVHEATHAVFDEDVRAKTGFTPDEVAALSFFCMDIGMTMEIATESLAHLNQARWCAAHYDCAPAFRHPSEGPVLTQALAFPSGPDSAFLFSQRMISYVLTKRTVYARAASASVPSKLCGPPIVRRGHGRGALFFPSDIAPTELVPLFNQLGTKSQISARLTP